MKKLPLPSPRSPHKLDRTILDYAEKNVPAKKSSFVKPLWVSGLATASIIGIAVIVSQPEHTGFTPHAETAVFSTEVAQDKPSSVLSRGNFAKAELLVPERAPAKKQKSQYLDGMDTSPATSGARFNINTVQDELRTLSVLLEKGKTSQAEAAYNALKQRCGNCELPATLAGALEKYTDTTAPPTP